MKCTDNNYQGRRPLSKRARRRRLLVRRMKRLLFLLCIIAASIAIVKISGREKNYVAEFENNTYNTSYYKTQLFASDLCIIPGSADKTLSKLSKLNSYGLFDVVNKESIYSYSVFDKIYPASTTKILTALVALENADLSDNVIVSSNACSTNFAWDEQTCGIKEGDLLTLEDLLYGLLLYSGNDTAVAIAEHVAGSVEKFADMMNSRAQTLMATGSHFINPSGLYDDDHYTTAYDLYLIFNECIKHDEFVEIINADSYRVKVKNQDTAETRTLKWEPTNYYALDKAKAPKHVTIIGGKTGTLKAAGNCLILMANDSSDNPYISVVMGAESKDLLYNDMTKILSEIPDNQ